jgi:hypothetical protein
MMGRVVSLNSGTELGSVSDLISWYLTTSNKHFNTAQPNTKKAEEIDRAIGFAIKQAVAEAVAIMLTDERIKRYDSLVKKMLAEANTGDSVYFRHYTGRMPFVTLTGRVIP